MSPVMQSGPRRGGYFQVQDLLKERKTDFEPGLLDALEGSDMTYRTLCAILFNFVPQSGHPGGSISSGRIVQSLLFHTMDYDFSNPDAMDNDLLSYAAG